MKYVLILVAILLAALGWLRPQPTPIWLVVAVLALLGISAALQLGIARGLSKDAAKRQFSGLLRKRSRLFFSSRRKGQLPQLELGDSGAVLRYDGPQGGPLFKIFDDCHLTIEVERNQPKVSTIIRDKKGNVVAELLRNEWKVNENTAFDRNYSKEALEVRDATGDVVLQIRLKEERIQFAGKFYDKNGRGIALGKNTDREENTGGVIEIAGPDHPDLQLRIDPLFRYPSDRHLGEYA